MRRFLCQSQFFWVVAMLSLITTLSACGQETAAPPSQVTNTPQSTAPGQSTAQGPTSPAPPSTSEASSSAFDASPPKSSSVSQAMGLHRAADPEEVAQIGKPGRPQFVEVYADW